MSPTGYAEANLDNSGESISLLGPAGELLQFFSYSDDAPWPTASDGEGPSLEYIGPFDQDALDPLSVVGDPYDDPNNWRASRESGGSPGSDGEPDRIPGDYDGSGYVDHEDYARWKTDFGLATSPGAGADGNQNGIVDLADYTVWRNNLGAGEPPAAIQALVSVAPESGGAGAALEARELPSYPTTPSAAKRGDRAANSATQLISHADQLLNADKVRRRIDRGSRAGDALACDEVEALRVADQSAAHDAIFHRLGNSLKKLNLALNDRDWS
jgi:hypothetical protein